MRIVEFGDDGQPVAQSGRLKTREFRTPDFGSREKQPLGREPQHGTAAAPGRGASTGVQLHMFQTGTLRTKVKYIKMNQGEDDYEIPVPWFLIRHPQGNVVIDGGNAAEVSVDARAHWGDVLSAYDPVVGTDEHCVEQLRGVGIAPEDVRYVLQSHLHLDHTGALGRFPRATTVVQRIEHEYAYAPDWFAKGAYIRADFDKRGIDWKMLGGEYTDHFDLFGDGTIRIIFTPGHSPGHQSFLIRLPNTGPVLLTVDAAYTLDHWNDKALPGLVCSSVDSARSVAKLRRIAAETGAMVVTGHDPDLWRSLKHAPRAFYD